MTTVVPDEVPYKLPLTDISNHEWTYSSKSLFHNQSSIAYHSLPSLNECKDGDKVGLLITNNGQLHLFLDGEHVAELATGLPVLKLLYGAVDVFGRCCKIKSEILSGELGGVCLSSNSCVYFGSLDVNGVDNNTKVCMPN